MIKLIRAYEMEEAIAIFDKYLEIFNTYVLRYASDSILALLIFIKVVFNLIPTKRSISVFQWLDNIIDHIIPNRKPN